MDIHYRTQTVPPELESFSLHPLLKRIYAARGIQTPVELDTHFQHLLPFHLLKGIDTFVMHLYEALQGQHNIVIVGDFDADGATSTALCMCALQSFGAQHVSYLVPNRFKYGYGLTPEIVEVAALRKPDVLITVDNGISSMEGVARAKALGIKVLITDHHLAADSLPDADAIVNPNQPGDTFPSKCIAGVGVIFYTMLALRSHLRQENWFVQQNIPEPNMAELLDLVALGTVADVVPLDHNNRILVAQGIKRIQAGKHGFGIQALLEVSKREAKRLTASDLGFAVAPRLNAAGRLEDMSLGIECLLASNLANGLVLAQRLDQLNRERKDIEQNMQQQAIAAISKLQLGDNMPTGVCLYDPDWHQGVIGIVASRIKDRLHRPVIAFAKVSEAEIKGSARSIPGIHIRDILDAIAKRHPELIQKFGGHAMAAGLSLNHDALAEFSLVFDQEIKNHLTEEDSQKKTFSDGALTQADLSLDVAVLLRTSGPWGQAFSEPLFDNQFEVLEQHMVGGKHLKLLLSLPGTSAPIEAIAFFVNVEKWPDYQVKKIHAAYRLDINEYQNRKKVQLLIEAFVPFSE